MKFTKERMAKMLDILGSAAIKYVTSIAIFQIIDGQQSWQGYFEEFEEGDGMVGILGEIIGSGNGQISEEEFDEIIRPHIAGRIANDLGAKKVVIEW